MTTIIYNLNKERIKGIWTFIQDETIKMCANLYSNIIDPRIIF